MGIKDFKEIKGIKVAMKRTKGLGGKEIRTLRRVRNLRSQWRGRKKQR